jgi:hypothetical protein
VSTRAPNRRVAGFALLVLAATVVAALAIVSGIRSADPAGKASPGAQGVLPAARAKRQPMVVYRVDHGRPNASGQIALAPLGASAGRPTLTPLSCDRVYFAATTGLCLARRSGFAAGYQAKVFGPDLRVRHTLAVPGVPSRARVSPDGRYGAVTLFVTGHSYATPGSFSTQTTLIDLARGKKIADLEQFVVLRGERRVTALDVNFWGVTFAGDSDRFYATLATGGKTYLIQGSVRAREAHVIHQNVECPSLSPDGTRIAYKKLVGSGSAPWRLTVLDLATMRETPLAEMRSVDDQVEWLDDAHMLYGVDGSIWRADADGGGQPSRFIGQADSPAVVRW